MTGAIGAPLYRICTGTCPQRGSCGNSSTRFPTTLARADLSGCADSVPTVPFPGYTSPQSHEERLSQLDKLLGSWRAYISEARPIHDASSLAADDKLFPVLAPSQLAWHGIASAVDHLDMFMALLRSGTSHPLAPNTVARTGMLSGAHALWLLDGPDRPERQKRGLRLAYEEFFRDHQAVTDIATIEAPDPERRFAEMKSYLDARTEWMARVVMVGEQLGMTAKDVKSLNDTKLLDEVTRRLVERDPESTELIRAVRVVWRTYSGVAHGLRWPVMYRAQYGEPVPGGNPGNVEARVTSSIADLSMAASSVSIFLLHAVDLFEKRRLPGNPVAESTNSRSRRSP